MRVWVRERENDRASKKGGDVKEKELTNKINEQMRMNQRRGTLRKKESERVRK